MTKGKLYLSVGMKPTIHVAILWCEILRFNHNLARGDIKNLNAHIEIIINRHMSYHESRSHHYTLKNYRPVSNLPFLSKVIEKTVNLRLQEHLEEEGLHDMMQSAYRSAHSTETALVRVTNDILCALDKNRQFFWYY